MVRGREIKGEGAGERLWWNGRHSGFKIHKLLVQVRLDVVEKRERYLEI